MQQERQFQLPEQFEEGLRKVLTSIYEQNGRVTRQSKVLKLFLSRGGALISSEDLEQIFVGTASDPNSSLRTAINRLNIKLAEVGLEIEHVPAYKTVKLK